MNFLAPFTGSADLRLLEVGCGRGELALLLSRRLKMTAIDSSETAILAALNAGVEAHLVDFFDYPEEPFDLVLFTRSLHHIHPLREAVARAARMCVPGGRLILEDFAAEKADNATVAWYFQARRELAQAGLLSSESALDAIENSTEPLAWWRHHHFDAHHVSTSAEMRAAIGEYFQIEEETFVPYMYRYLVADLLSGVHLSDVEWAIFGDEQRLCELGKICKIGYRLVAIKK